MSVAMSSESHPEPMPPVISTALYSMISRSSKYGITTRHTIRKQDKRSRGLVIRVPNHLRKVRVAIVMVSNHDNFLESRTRILDIL